MNSFTYEKKNHKVFNISSFGRKHNLILVPGYYNNNSLAIRVLEITSDGYPEPYAVLTVNTDASELFKDQPVAFVKNYSENEEWAEKLADMIGEKTGVTTQTGFVSVPQYKFDLDKIYN